MKRYLLPIPIGLGIMFFGTWLHFNAIAVPPPYPWQIGATLEVLGLGIGMFGGFFLLLRDISRR